MLLTDRQLVSRPAKTLQQYHFTFCFTFLFSSLHVFFDSTGNNFFYFHVLTLMAPKLESVYTRRLLKFIAPSAWLVIRSDDERDPEYVPPGTITNAWAARTINPPPRRWRPGSHCLPVWRGAHTYRHAFWVFHTLQGCFKLWGSIMFLRSVWIWGGFYSSHCILVRLV